MDMTLEMDKAPAAEEMEAPKYSVQRYTPGCRAEWDRFVAAGKNATFLFRRDYMDYHADRFEDHSLVVRKDDQVVALLPANLRSDGVLVSHGGLTYGGFVLRRDAVLTSVIEIVEASLSFLHKTGIDTLIYKRVPRFYNTLPDDDIDYTLFVLEAQLIRRDCSQVVCRADRLPISRGKKSKINRGGRSGLVAVQDESFEPFWKRVLEPRLMQRFGVRPVHSVEEIAGLAYRLPEHIKQYSAYAGEDIMAGVTVYETPTVAHMQYIAVTDEGEALCALEYLFDWLMRERYADKAFFDFGICNESEGRVLNRGLLQFKEGFGARTFSHDFYAIATDNHVKLSTCLLQRAEP